MIISPSYSRALANETAAKMLEREAAELQATLGGPGAPICPFSTIQKVRELRQKAARLRQS